MKHILYAFLLVALAGCGTVTPPVSRPAPVEIRTEAAPQAGQREWLRVNDVRRTGSSVALGLSLATSDSETKFPSHSFQVTTNTGVVIPFKPDAREIAKHSIATIRLAVTLPEANVTSLTLRLGTPAFEVAVPLPPRDGAYAWPEAPLRQTGLTNALMRTTTGQALLTTIRSSGLVTEVSYEFESLHPWSKGFCNDSSASSNCTITEANGTVHRLIGKGPTVKTPFGRARGTLRFLGELNPSETSLTLKVPVSATNDPTKPLTVTLPTHADSPVRAVAQNITRAQGSWAPISLTDPETKGQITIEGVDVLADHVQLRVSIAASDQRIALVQGMSGDESHLIEPDGFVHRLVTTNEAKIKVEPRAQMKARLVFLGTVLPDVQSLQLSLATGWTTKLTATIPLPAKPEPPESGPMLGAPTPSPIQVAAIPASPAPVLAFDVQALPGTTGGPAGSIFTEIDGVALGSSEQVGASAEAEAQKTLADLGAQRTPDGWVLTLPETVLFDYNKADLRAEAKQTITKVSKLLQHFAKAKIKVLGHADNTGDAGRNQELSKRRAESVRDALAAQHVATNRMTVEGYGASRPVASNDSDAGRAQNRRVEIVLNEETL